MTQTESGRGAGDPPDEGAMLSIARVERIGESVILYDASLAGQPREAWFDPAHWDGTRVAADRSGGRGTTLFVRHDGQDWVLKHYHRGGAVARFTSDGFVWAGEERTRAFAEWRLLGHMIATQLPVPRPVAARYRRRGLVYRCDLITVRIPGAVSLSTRLATGALPAATWRSIGACIARFHHARIFHADLNAHNVQLDSREAVFLLDFDRGRVMPQPGPWCRRNLERLHRSLVKVSREGGASFASGDWTALLEGYAGPLLPP